MSYFDSYRESLALYLLEEGLNAELMGSISSALAQYAFGYEIGMSLIHVLRNLERFLSPESYPGGERTAVDLAVACTMLASDIFKNQKLGP